MNKAATLKLLSLSLLCLSVFVIGDLYAQKKKKGKKAKSAEAAAKALKSKQYKKVNRDAFTKVAEGDAQAGLDFAAAYLKKNPKDLESDFIEAAAYVKQGKLDAAMVAVNRSLEKGLPLERYLAGPRNMFKDLYAHAEFKKLVDEKKIDLIHGPMLGAIEEKAASIWLRTARESEIEISLHDEGGMQVATMQGKTKAADDYTAVLRFEKLKQEVTYLYQLKIDGRKIELPWKTSFTTFPDRGQATKFKIGFGGGAGFTPWYEYMWERIADEKFSTFLMLGDNVYIDHPESREAQRYCYYRRQSRPEYRAFTASTSQFAVWDDHDFGANDCTSSLSLDSPPWKMDVLEVFKQNWVNPAYGSQKHPGIWHKFAIGDVDFFMTDGRFYRQNPKKFDTPTMLGPDQKKWLLEGLKSSKATFKVICSAVPMSSDTKGGSLDTWDGFPEEREAIFSYIADQKINGVFILAADRHRHDAWRLKRKKGYDLYEFMSSRLTNIHSHGIQKKDHCLFGVGGLGYGRVTFDTRVKDPTVTYEIVNNKGEVPISEKDGKTPCRITLKLSQLTH